MKKRILLIPLALLLAMSLGVVVLADTSKFWYEGTWVEYPESYHVAVVADLHIPEEPNWKRPYQDDVIDMFNTWEDLDLVVSVGDTVDKGGSAASQVEAKEFLDQLEAVPYRVIVGNHDYIYADSYIKNPKTGHTTKQGPDGRIEKLEFFVENWGLEDVFWSERLGNYLLVFLSADGLYTNHYCECSPRQLEWLEKELGQNKDVPTIIFHHCPLKGSFIPRPFEIGPTGMPVLDSYYAEPADEIREILLANEQVFMWVAGHLHKKPAKPDFASDINLWEDQVWVIHCPNLNSGEVIWTNHLILLSDPLVQAEVRVMTYNHDEDSWLEEFERHIKVPEAVKAW